MTKTLLILFLISALSGVVISHLALPETYNFFSKTLGGIIAGAGCMLILTMNRLMD